jgi:POT family proton-dependent oligopeptide transporter
VAAVALGFVRVDPVTLAAVTGVVIASMAVLYFAWILLFGGLDAVEKKRVGAIIVLFIACAAFWSGFEQAGSSLNLFAERYTDRLIGSFELPAGMFQSLNALFILLLAPVFSALWVSLARRNLDPSAPVKFALGLIIMGSGFLVMFQAAEIVAAGMKAAPYWLILTYLLHTMGELCLSPVGLSNITKLAPARYVGQMMGIWFLATSLGNLLAGLIAGEFDAENVAGMPAQYLQIVAFAVGVGLVTLLVSGPVKRWMGGVK